MRNDCIDVRISKILKWNLWVSFFPSWDGITKNRSTAAGFEPTRECPNGFQVHRLNHSARQPDSKYLLLCVKSNWCFNEQLHNYCPLMIPSFCFYSRLREIFVIEVTGNRLYLRNDRQGVGKTVFKSGSCSSNWINDKHNYDSFITIIRHHDIWNFC